MAPLRVCQAADEVFRVRCHLEGIENLKIDDRLVKEGGVVKITDKPLKITKLDDVFV
jgi:hypothetical protein